MYCVYNGLYCIMYIIHTILFQIYTDEESEAQKYQTKIFKNFSQVT